MAELKGTGGFTSAAKIRRPGVPWAVARQVLYDRFDGLEKGAGTPAVWLSGPPGSGKTTLVSGYLDARGRTALWYQVDSGDADLASLFYYLGAAARRAGAEPLPLFTADYALGVQEFSRTFFEELFGRLPSLGALVFDDVQAVPEDAAFHGALIEGLTRLPEGVRVFLLSRGEPPPAYARLRAVRSLDLVGRAELRLSLAEFAEIARRRGAQLPEAELARLHSKMDGWAAGLHLLLEALRLEGADLRDFA